jgi:hypothetical protein
MVAADLTYSAQGVMNRDKSKDSTNGLPALAAFRGIYNRVATRLNVDPSYVSRVARGERRSAAILAALEEEIANIREQLNHHVNGQGNVNGYRGAGGATSDDAAALMNGAVPQDGNGRLPPAAKKIAQLNGK